MFTVKAKIIDPDVYIVSHYFDGVAEGCNIMGRLTDLENQDATLLSIGCLEKELLISHDSKEVVVASPDYDFTQLCNLKPAETLLFALRVMHEQYSLHFLEQDQYKKRRYRRVMIKVF